MSVRAPTRTVWLATLLVILHALLWLSAAAMLIVDGVQARVNGQSFALLELDPLLLGLVMIVLTAFLGWLHYAAVRHRSRSRSFLIGVLFFILGVLTCILIPWGAAWDVAHYAVVGADLFIGISMVRWGIQLARR